MPKQHMADFVYDPAVIREMLAVATGQGSSGTARHSNMYESLTNMTWMWTTSVSGTTIPKMMAENEQLVWQDGQATWQSVTSQTAAQKAKRGLNPLTMVATGKLYRAATTVRAPGNVAYGDKTTFYYGINITDFRSRGSSWAYPHVHQHTGVGRAKVRRQWLYIRRGTRQRLNSFFGRALRIRVGQVAKRSRLYPALRAT